MIPVVPVEQLQKTQIVNGMTPEQAAVLGSYGELRQLKDGEAIVKANDGTYDLSVLLTGKACVQGAVEKEVQVMTPGAVIGELSFFDRKPRSANVLAVGDSSVAVFSGDLLTKLRADHPDVAVQFVQNLCLLLCDKLRGATRLIDALSIMNV